VPEGGSTFTNNMTMIMDGHTTVEHNVPIAPLYEDVLRLWQASKTASTPTLIVNYAGLSGEYWWYQHDSVWANPRLRNFSPVAQLEARSRRRMMAADDDYFFVDVAKSAKALADRGVLVNMGAHGQLDGLGAHWELWMLQMGGMSNHQALKAATINPATTLGMEQDIGSLQRGKLADLLVLDANPLDNIRNSTSIKWVMINGRLYDANTMAQLGNHPAPAPKPTWRE
jgi:imidazolonepropionase-like amidohydrolase